MINSSCCSCDFYQNRHRYSYLKRESLYCRNHIYTERRKTVRSTRVACNEKSVKGLSCIGCDGHLYPCELHESRVVLRSAQEHSIIRDSHGCMCDYVERPRSEVSVIGGETAQKKQPSNLFFAPPLYATRVPRRKPLASFIRVFLFDYIFFN